MQLTILGNGSGGAFQGRNYTAHFLQIENQYFLLDCGEGTQHQAWRLRLPLDKIRQIFISHLHGDHVFGLIGLLTSFSLKDRTAPLEIFAPAGLKELIDVQEKICGVRFSFPIQIQEVDTTVSKIIFENKNLEVLSLPLNHRVPTIGWLFREKPNPRHILREKIEAHQIPFSKISEIKNGADFELPDGGLVPNSELTTEPSASKTYAFCTDTAYHEPLAKWIEKVELLYHEATFTEKHREQANISNHSTAADAASMARLAGVKRLILGHFSNRYETLEEHLAEARPIFPNVEIGEEGVKIEI